MLDATNLLAKEIEQGEPVDVAILTPAALAALMKQGKLVEGSSVTIARVGLGVVVKQGAPKPDISSVAAFKDMLVKAKTVSYTTAGAKRASFAVAPGKVWHRRGRQGEEQDTAER